MRVVQHVGHIPLPPIQRSSSRVVANKTKQLKTNKNKRNTKQAKQIKTKQDKTFWFIFHWFCLFCVSFVFDCFVYFI